MQGRIYTDIHGRMDHPEFHVNRLHETPKVKILTIKIILKNIYFCANSASVI